MVDNIRVHVEVIEKTTKLRYHNIVSRHVYDLRYYAVVSYDQTKYGRRYAGSRLAKGSGSQVGMIL